MNATDPNRTTALDVPCPRCHAASGQLCRVVIGPARGRVASGPHPSRSQAARAAAALRRRRPATERPTTENQ